MKKLFPAIFLFLFISSTGLAQTPRPTASPTPKKVETEDDVVKISTTLIQVDVTVTDKNGKIVTDLKPEDFEIFENKEKQEITNFSFVAAPEVSPSPVPTPKNSAKDPLLLPPPPTALRPEQVRRTIALVVDDLSLSFESAYYVRQALKKFIDRQMQEGDLVAIIRTGGGVGALQQFTSDKRQLYAAMEKIRWNPNGVGKIGAFAPIAATPLEQAQAEGADVSPESLAAEKRAEQGLNDFRESIFSTGTLGALNYIIRGMRELPGRKSVMLLSDGFKLFTQDESGFIENTRIWDPLKRLTDLANRSSVVIYTMDARGLQTLGLSAADNTSGLSPDQVEARLSGRRADLRDTQDGLFFLARETGGFAIVNNNDLSGGIRKVLEDQKGYYLIGYAPDSDTFDPKTRRFNKLDVKVKRPGVKVRYRSGFFGVSDEDTRRPAEQPPQQRILAALTSPFAVNGISLHLNAIFVHDPKTGSSVRSLLHVNAKDLKFTDTPDGSRQATFEVLAMSFGDNGVVVDQLSKNYTMTLKDDAYQRILRDGFVYNLAFPIKKAGAYQFRVALRDNASQQVGSANQFIEVPNVKKGGLTLSGVVMENLTLKQWENLESGAASSPPPAAAAAAPDVRGNSAGSKSSAQTDTSLRRFKRGTILRYGYEIYNAKLDASRKPQLTVRTRVFRDGKPLFEGKENPVESAGQKDLQRIAASSALSFGGAMQPGDYVLQIIVTDNLAKGKRRIASQFVQFEIVE